MSNTITLYPHNLSAYNAATEMLASTGKAAIVHPTGTGKSFIGFKLCEDNPDSKVLWLSPSEYIFNTQLENLKATGAEVPANITFYTYARLMITEELELKTLTPDFIILDEFHRAGAEGWGRGVQRLIALYPEAKLLGLSATNIRYLDRQRDMADELFDGNIASEMTLGEAIVRGILTAPKYVLTLFSYRAELEKYEHKIRTSKNKAVREAATEYYEALRRTLENAEGMDVIFDRHMTDRTGKYLVFCSNLEHMDEMIHKVPEWFSKVDTDPHIYRVYADDPKTEKAFKAFKEDTSEHLKLLFCIDMLNEGVHVEDVSGVILLRPTVSPIVYKQQIGRALSASRKKDAVIFDVVLNFENLYSISSIREEMDAAITYYRYLGEYKSIVTEKFEVIDEVRDCRRLFDELEATLNASWDLMYQEAKKYYLSHGDLMIPAKYKTEDGFSLGSWLSLQRRIYTGKADGYLTDDQVEKLNSIGIVWDAWHDLNWECNYLAAKAYYEKYGDLYVPLRYTTETGFPLGVWIMRMRQAHSNGRTGVLTEERFRKLNEIGMSWDALSDQWERNFLEAANYYREHGDLLVPGRYVTPNGIKLGNWIAHLRTTRNGKGNGALTEEQIRRLDSIGMAWDADEERWRMGYEASLLYAREHGNLNVPLSYITKDGYKLGAWISLKRRQYKKSALPAFQVRELERIGMCWDARPQYRQVPLPSRSSYRDLQAV